MLRETQEDIIHKAKTVPIKKTFAEQETVIGN